jgi:hypothetical protein
MNMEQLVICKLAGEAEVFRKNVPQCKFMNQQCVSTEKLLDAEVLTHQDTCEEL